MPNGEIHNRFLTVGGTAFRLHFLEPLSHKGCRLVVFVVLEGDVGVLPRLHLLAILSSTGIGLFAKHHIKRNTIIGTFWGRYIVLPMDESNWAMDSLSQMHGCRNRIMHLHQAYQPVIGINGFDANNQVSALSSNLCSSHISL
jgi:hypothetical protein